MDILVTGGCGFIGSHLVDRLVADGHHVTVIDNMLTGKRANLNPAAKLYLGDVADAALVHPRIARCDAVFHLAAVASVEACENDLFDAHRTNYVGCETVLEGSQRAGRVPVIYASSAAVYGDNPDLPLAESAEAKPLSKYGVDKYAAEKLAAEAWRLHRIPSVGLRFFNVYGPRQDATSPYSGVISKFVGKALTGTPLTFLGDGEQTRDFIYVGDIVELLVAALGHATGAAVYNGCTGKAVSLKQLASAIGAATGAAITARHGEPRIGDIRHSCGDPSLAEAQLGFRARTSLEEGLRKLVAADA